MPGPQVKDWNMYHGLRKAGKSKESAARIANANAGKNSKKSPNEAKKQALERRMKKNEHKSGSSKKNAFGAGR